MTLYEILISNGATIESVLPAVDRALESTPETRSDLREGTDPEAWSFLKRQVGKHLASLLDVEVGEILVRAWRRYRLLEEYADTSKHPPGETNVLSLAEHTISSSHEPRLEVLVGKRVASSISLDVTVELQIAGINLSIENARVKEIRLARLVVGGTVGCHGVELIKKETGPIDLPGVISLGDGIPVSNAPQSGTEI